METIRFDETSQAFEVQECNAAQGPQISMPADLLSLDVIHAYKVHGCLYISLRESLTPL